ncbi:MAG TPA: glycosyltransferase [Ktedonobacteraceae bacterium]|nr:glycosyltransferase [Ktedonobacteraceae bacterium]
MNHATGRPKVSIIIPSWTGAVSRTVNSIEQQTFHDYELDVVQGVSPAAAARNLAAQRAKGEILLFVDDDARLGHERVLELMVNLLESDARVAVVGVSQQIPVEATPFQYGVARQVPRTTSPVVSSDLVSNPPLDSYGFTTITTTCCAVRRTVFEQVGGFDEALPTGEDTDFFYRVRRLGYNLVVTANCYVYHEPAASVKALIRKSFWYGIGHALEVRKSPERGAALLPLNRWYGKLGLIAAILAFPLSFFVHYYFDTRRLVFSFRPLKTLSTYANLCGYLYGWYHGKPYNRAPVPHQRRSHRDLESSERQTQ